MHKLKWVQNLKISPGRDITDHIPSKFVYFHSPVISHYLAVLS